jgi:glycosyltransferase involved in cell wall biosynthesis
MHVLICAVSSSRQPSGICRHAASLARCLAERSEITQLTLLVGRWQAWYFVSAFALGFPKLQVVPVDLHHGAPARNIWYLRELPAVIRRFAPDIVHLSFPLPLLRGSFACPAVTSLHDLYPYDMPENFGHHRAIFNRLFLRQSLRNSTSVVCSSDFTLSRLQSLTPHANAKAIRIYPSVDFKAGVSEELAAPALPKGPFVLCVAQHRRNKNLALLLRAFSELTQCGGRLEAMNLVIVGGPGPETAHLKHVVRQLLLQRKVVFLAAVADAAMRWLYQNSELLVATSSIEGFGLPIIEALQCGTRVVCSDIPVFREIAGDVVRYFNLHSASPATELANAMVAASHDPSPQPGALDRFRGSAIAEQHLSLYSQLLAIQGLHNVGEVPELLDADITYDGLPG